MLIGWCVVALAIGGWVAGNLFGSTYWTSGHDPVISESQTWSALGVNIQTNQAMHGTTITIPGQNPVQATDNAFFIAVVLNYTLDSATVDQDCSVTLVGNGRTWSSDPPTGLGIGDVSPGTTSTCRAPADGTLSGTFGALFEIPKSALGEIQGVQVLVTPTYDQSHPLNKATLFQQATAQALMKITIK